MAESKVFPMNTFVSVLRGRSADVAQLDMLAFVLQVEAVDADAAPLAQALVKAHIYEIEPALTKYAEGDLGKLGNQVKIVPMAAPEQAQAVLEAFAAMKADLAGAQDAAAKAEDANKALTKEVADLKAKVKTFDDASKGAEKAIMSSNTKIDEHIKKLNDLLAEVEKVKKEGVVVAGVAGDGAAAPAEGGGASGDSPDTGGEPEADFGFGSNPFADSDW
jgi:deoxyribodipyrimidine photolyase